MKILILTQWFTPEPDLKGLPFALELQKSHNVEVLTGFPNYPGGKIYDGYKLSLFRKEKIQGVTVNRVWLYPSHSLSKIGRVLNYLSFAITASLWSLFSSHRFDVVYVYHPPATIALPAMVLKLFRRTRVVYDIQDLWPDTLAATGMIQNPRVLRIIGSLMKSVYKHCDDIVVLSPGFKRVLIERGVAGRKVHIIYNWSLDIEKVHSDVSVNFKMARETGRVILFAGTMGKAQGLETIIRVAEKCQIINLDYRFVFLGGGICFHQLKELSKQMNLRNVSFLPRVSSSEVSNYLLNADLLLVHLVNDPLFTITIPSKIQAYMRIGKPIICGVSGDADSLVRKADCGYSFMPECEDSLLNLLKELESVSDAELSQKGMNGANYYKDNLDISVGVKSFEEIFRKYS